ncbi:unnamed protein product [Ixodes persulcatus]
MCGTPVLPMRITQGDNKNKDNLNRTDLSITIETKHFFPNIIPKIFSVYRLSMSNSHGHSSRI